MEFALKTTQLSKTYGNGVTALQSVDLAVPQGDFYALLGPNGAGKSTVIGVLASLVIKTAGRVEVFGVDIDRNFPQAKSFLGVVPQEFNFNIFETPLQIVRNQAGYYGIDRRTALARTEQYLTLLGLWEKRNDQAGQLSGGMKRRLMIARALVHEPRLLILDEPTTGLDPIMGDIINDLIVKCVRELGATALSITHDMASARKISDHIAMLYKGKIIWIGNTEEIDSSGEPRGDQFIHGRAEGPIQMELRRL